MKTLSQYVFDDLTIFDNDGEMFGRIGEQAQILEWIAVDEKNICPRILGDHSEWCLPVRIAFAGKTEEFGISRREHPKCFGIAVVITESRRHFTLPRRKLRLEQKIRTPRCFDTVLACPAVHIVSAGADFAILFCAARIRIVVIAQREGLHRKPDVLLSHQSDRRLVSEMTVLDGFHASFDGAANAGDVVNVGGDVGARRYRGADSPARPFASAEAADGGEWCGWLIGGACECCADEPCARTWQGVSNARAA